MILHANFQGQCTQRGLLNEDNKMMTMKMLTGVDNNKYW